MARTKYAVRKTCDWVHGDGLKTLLLIFWIVGCVLAVLLTRSFTPADGSDWIFFVCGVIVKGALFAGVVIILLGGIALALGRLVSR